MHACMQSFNMSGELTKRRLHCWLDGPARRMQLLAELLGRCEGLKVIPLPPSTNLAAAEPGMSRSCECMQRADVMCVLCCAGGRDRDAGCLLYTSDAADE